MKYIQRILSVAVLAGSFFLSRFLAQAADGPKVFEEAPRPATYRAESFVKRDRFVKFHKEFLESIHPERFHPGAQPQLHMNLFDDADYTLVLGHAEKRPHGRTVYTGQFKEVTGSMGVVTHADGIMTGIFFIPGKGTFKILPAGNGLHRIMEVDEEKGLQCGLDGSHPGLSDSRLAAGFPQEGMPWLIPLNYPAGCHYALNPTVLNLAVVYTPAALGVMGSAQAMESLIDTVVFYNNMVYFNSGINAQMQLVYSGQVNYTEQGSMFTDLPNMGNGTISAIQAIQSSYGAVMVNMLVAGSDPVMGLGFLPGHYSMEHVIFAEAMIHEMGHNLGCGHDFANGGPGVYSYSAGNRYTSQGVQYRTIMAYAPGVYTPYFSTPLETYLGVATGVANTEDNARTINQTAPPMAASVPPASGLDVPTVSLTSPPDGSVMTGPLTLALTASAASTAGIAQVDFFVDSQFLGTSTSSPYDINWPLVPSGSHFITAHAINKLGTAQFSCPISIYVNSTLPSPWVDQDIGWLMQTTATPLELKYMRLLGSSSYSGGTFTVNGAGFGIGMNLSGIEQDSFQFVSQPSCGYSTLTARLTGIQNGSSNNQAGLMFRDNSADDSPYVYLGMAYNGAQAVFAYRSTQGGNTTSFGGPNPPAPVWFQLQRSGNIYTGYESVNGSTWTQVGAVTLTTIGANPPVGFAVSSAGVHSLASATFDNVSLSISCVPPTPTSTPTSTCTPTITPTGIYLTPTNTPAIVCGSNQQLVEFLDTFPSSASLSNYTFYTLGSAVSMTAASLNYAVNGGELQQSSSAGATLHSYVQLNAAQFSWAYSNYTVEADFKLDHRTDNYGLFGLEFLEQANVTGYIFQWNGNSENGANPHWQIQKDTGAGGSAFTYLPPAGFGTGLAAPVYTPGNWVHLKVVVAGSTFYCYVNLYDGNGDQLVYSLTDTTASPPYTSGGVGFRTEFLLDPNMAHIRNYHVYTCIDVITNTPTPTPTSTLSPTVTPTPTNTTIGMPTATSTPTFTSTGTPTSTKTQIIDAPISTTTPLPTDTPTPTPTVTETPTATYSSTPTSTYTITSSPTNSMTPSATFTASFTPTSTSTYSPTVTATPIVKTILYPDPARGPEPVTLQFALNDLVNQVSLKIFTTVFRKVNENSFSQLPPGIYQLPVELKDFWGMPLANGLYYVVVDINFERKIFKLLVLK